MHLSGWKRIGIVLSVIWIVAAFFYQRNVDQSQAQNWMNMIYKTCTDTKALRGDFDFKPCMDKAWSDSRVFDGGWPNAAFLALAPIPIGWLLAYLLFAILRWVRRGFA
jgi:hypothetical protein